jgi:hypothetical protein
MNDLLFTQGKDNLAGLVDKIFICPVDDIASVPALAAATSLKTAATAIACKTGKKFVQLYITDETGKIEIKSVGNRDGRGRESMLTGRYPAIGTELEDFIRSVQNTPCVIIFRQARDGKLFLLGVSQLDITSTTLSTTIPAYFEQGDSSSGEKRSDQNGALLGWKFTAAHGPIEYASTVPLTPAP